MSLATATQWALEMLIKRETSDPDDETEEPVEKEVYASWSLSILIVLLILALFTSYVLQTRRIQAVHETVISIFAGMVVGLVLRLTSATSVLGAVTFNYQFFFNLLLPPIILSSGYELHQGNFFRNIGTILTFAFAGTFISAVVLGVILWLWSIIPLEAVKISFVEAMSVGATLSATDPVTILAIFTSYKVDPKLYTVIFGESILNDAIAIVLFETAQKYKVDLDGVGEEAAKGGSLTILTVFESIGIFLLVFFGSLVIGVAIGVATSLMLKLTHVRRFPKIESCLILLIAYLSYFFSNAIHMSGIVSLLFCGICMKHYAYHNMSRRTQLTTKFIFQIMAQLSENFIFIYLGLSLFTDSTLDFKPLFILITVVGICVARYLAVFPLSRLINAVIRYRARKHGRDAAEEIPHNHQIMLYWAGLRGAVGVALAAGLTGPNGQALRATVLVVVVLTVIIFGGTTARMLEILQIRTGVVEEIDSDDEFDIEVVHGTGQPNSGIYSKGRGQGIGNNPRRVSEANGTYALGDVNKDADRGSYTSGNMTPPIRPNSTTSRRQSNRNIRENGTGVPQEAGGLLSPDQNASPDDDDTDLDLPPSARRSPHPAQPASSSASSPYASQQDGSFLHPQAAAALHEGSRDSPSMAGRIGSGAQAIGQLISGISEDPANAFRQIDEGFIKPHLLLDPKGGHGGNNV